MFAAGLQINKIVKPGLFKGFGWSKEPTPNRSLTLIMMVNWRMFWKMEQTTDTFWEGNCYKSYGYVQTCPSLYHKVHLPDPPAEKVLNHLVAMNKYSSGMQSHTKLRQLFFNYLYALDCGIKFTLP